jgi:hypothetical protein
MLMPTTRPGDYGMCSKVTIKSKLIVFHKPKEWEPIWARILEEHGARMAIRWVMQRDLGFTVRHHRGLVPNLPGQSWRGGSNMHYEDQIHLDFFTDAAQSWFQLRYL